MSTKAVQRVLALGVLLSALIPVHAGDVTLSATLGIGGRYRPGTWLPVTVGLTNSGPAALQGQVQIAATPSFGPGAAGAVWARPVRLPPATSAPQTLTLCARGLVPDREDVTLQFVAGLERGDGRVLAPRRARRRWRAPPSPRGTCCWSAGLVTRPPSRF